MRQRQQQTGYTIFMLTFGEKGDVLQKGMSVFSNSKRYVSMYK